MKRLLALLLAALMLLSLTACSTSNDDDDDDRRDDNDIEEAVDLETFEMEAFPDGVEDPALVTIGYPDNFTKEDTGWCVILTDEDLDVEIEAYFTNDYNCYDINEEYAEEEYYHYASCSFGKYDGYVCMVDEYSANLEVYVYLDCVAEMDDVYVTFYISSASQDLDADPLDFFDLPEVQDVLNSLEYTAPAK